MPRKNKGYTKILYGYLTKENMSFLREEVKEKRRATGDKLYSRSDFLNAVFDYHRTRKHHTPKSLAGGKLVRGSALKALKLVKNERKAARAA